ncbi:MAG: gephyrin-like molybdotransferase Glp [Fimbriimonadaceae bacterium]
MVAEAARLLSYEEALALVLKTKGSMGREVVALSNLVGRTLAEPLVSRFDQPYFDSSAVDGYAFAEKDVRLGLVGRTFDLSGELQAGSSISLELVPGSVARVFTGAPLPKGTGAVVMQEDIDRSGDRVAVRGAVELGEHVRRQGEEIRAGELLLAAPTLIAPAELGAIAAAGFTEAVVFRQPNVGLLVTGNELQTPGSELMPGQVFESNSHAISSALLAMGLPEPTIRQSSDNVDELSGVIQELLQSCDLLITTGGVSVGDYDLVRPVFQSLGVRQVFWGVAIKPGKPVYFGQTDRCSVFALPGNPVSALTAFLLFVRPLLLALQMHDPSLKTVRRKLTQELSKKAGRCEFVPARMDDSHADPMTGRASHKASSLVGANGFVVLAAQQTKAEKGAMVDVLPLNWGIG